MSAARLVQGKHHRDSPHDFVVNDQRAAIFQDNPTGTLRMLRRCVGLMYFLNAVQARRPAIAA